MKCLYQARFSCTREFFCRKAIENIVEELINQASPGCGISVALLKVNKSLMEAIWKSLYFRL